VTNATGAPRPDDEQLGAGGSHSAEEIAQRFAVNEDGPRVPSAALEFGRRAIELFRGSSRSRGVRAPDFTRNRRRTWDAAP
jgi:hypothetical protein